MKAIEDRVNPECLINDILTMISGYQFLHAQTSYGGLAHESIFIESFQHYCIIRPLK